MINKFRPRPFRKDGGDLINFGSTSVGLYFQTMIRPKNRRASTHDWYKVSDHFRANTLLHGAANQGSARSRPVVAPFSYGG
ncbi:MAG TPA: hypothetical protein VK619_06660 [Pyrinomonadaceae bacterium]|nr:hypothetical protein [Pyrinomonadaceae bacterium]